jgi:hypothetical protein
MEGDESIEAYFNLGDKKVGAKVTFWDSFFINGVHFKLMNF